MTNTNDFRYMHQGKPIADLKKEDSSLLSSINFRAKNKKRALLLLHGFTSTPAVYRFLIPNLKNYDAITCPALPGHSESILAFSKSTFSDWLLCARQECEALVHEYQKVDILGLSLGGLLACELSLNFKFNHMYLLAPALSLKINLIKSIKLLKVLKSLGFCEFRAKSGNIQSCQYAEISYRRLPIAPCIDLLMFLHHFQWTAPNCPVDLFLGAHDLVVDSPHIKQMYSNVPNTQIHWLENSAHVLPLDNDLNQIISCINEQN